MRYPLVSVIMVTYNSASYVKSAIESVLAQTTDDFELILSDDCSRDNTWDIVQPYASDCRVRLHRHERNLGEYPNRVSAADRAQGKYLIFVDGDDILYPHGLDLLTTTLESFPEAAFALSREWDERYIYPVQLSPREFFRATFLGRTVLNCVFPYLLFRTEAYRAVGGLHPDVRSGDTHLCMRLALCYSCVLTWGSVAWWRERPGQATMAVLRDPMQQSEGVRFAMNLLTSPDCPLDEYERRLALRNVEGVFIRSILRRMAHGHIGQAIEMLRIVALPRAAWHSALIPSHRPYHPGPFPQRVGASRDPVPPDWAKLKESRDRVARRKADTNS